MFLCLFMTLSNVNGNYVDYLLTFQIKRDKNMCAQVYIEPFIYDEFKTLKYHCSRKVYNIQPYTLKDIHVQGDQQIESYCPNNQGTMNLTFNSADPLKVKMHKTIVYRFQVNSEECPQMPIFSYSFDPNDPDKYLGVKLRFVVSQFNNDQPYSIFYVDRENFIDYAQKFAIKRKKTKNLLAEQLYIFQ